MKNEGATEDQIRDAILQKKKKKIEKYGNKSRVGVIIEQRNEKLLSN